MPRIAAIATALPSHRLSQEEGLAACQKLYGEDPALKRLLRVFESSGVRERWFSFPVEYYGAERTFQERNDDWIQQATRLAEPAAHRCLAEAGVEAEAIQHLLVVTTTGLATPSLDALLAPRLKLSPACRRWPIFGLGCAGGAGALVRAADLARNDPDVRILVVAVELCGQIFSPKFRTPVDVVGNALFGEGAVAVLMTGDRVAAAGHRVVGTRSHLFERTAHVMGWDFGSEGMRLRLSQEIPGLIRGPLDQEVRTFLRHLETPREKLAHWILHPGGRKILDSYALVFGLSEEAQSDMRRSLAQYGNLASASVLFVLDAVLGRRRPRPGERALVLALGPGFGAEMLLLEG